MIFSELDEFQKEFKKLCKKYRSLEEDFDIFRTALEDDPVWSELPKEHIVPISGLWKSIEGNFYKVKKFLCISLRSNTDIRIVYKYSQANEAVEFCEINFIEIYHKNTKDNHNIERIKKHYKI